MNDHSTTLEDIERRQKLLSLLFRIFIAVLILIGCVVVGWLISFIGYAADLTLVDFAPERLLASLPNMAETASL